MLKASTVFFLASLTVAGAQERGDIYVKLSAQETQALLTLMDAGLKSIGGSAAQAYVVLYGRIEEARKAPSPGEQQRKPEPAK